ncbi:MAG: ornithine carbamoyltransferase [Alphaproteobacteria bacterium]|nr:ornithine carbamoyltransferase [Alphaproteobacteria bacterium]
MTSAPKHFIDLDVIDKVILREILDLGVDLKKSDPSNRDNLPLVGKTLAMMFEKPSTRTRVSFEVGMRQLGGEVVVLPQSETQFGHGETMADTARVLSRFVDVIMLRTDDPQKLADLAEYATVPVINGLTDQSHPCQLMADVMTFEQHRGPIAGRTVAYTGDGNNVVNSFVHAASQFDFSLRLACPDSLRPDPAILRWAVEAGADVTVTDDPMEAVDQADCVVTDTWVSMHNKEDDRVHTLTPYRVTVDVMRHAKKGARFMHGLPAHRGDEVVDEVMDGPWSVVWDEAENRLHAQKGILQWCLS